MSYPEGHTLKRSFAILAVLGLATVNLLGMTGAAGGGVAPEFTTLENQLVFEGDALSFYVNASDADGDAVTIFAVSGLPTGVTVDDTTPDAIIVSWTPTNLQAGDWPMCFRASDGTEYTDSCNVVRVSDVEDMPVYVPINDVTLVEGKSTRFYVAAGDPDGDVLSYGVRNGTSGMSFNAGTRLVTWNPGFCSLRSKEVDFVVTDGTLESTERVWFNTTNVNRLPEVLPALDAAPVVQNRSTSNVAQATDIDMTECGDDSLRYVLIKTARDTLTGDPLSGAALGTYFLNSATGELTWNTTLSTPVGLYNFTVRALDNANKWVNVEVYFEVLKNELPVLIVDSPALVDVWTTVTFDATDSFDPEGTDVHSFEWDFDAGNVSFNVNRTGPVVTWTFVEPGFYNVTMRARDGDGQSNSTKIPIIVDDVVNVSLKLVRNSVNIISANAATVTLTTWNGTAIAGTDVSIQVVHDQSGDIVNEFVVKTDADGTVTFVIPRDEEQLINRMGGHTVTAHVLVANTFLGDSEEDEDVKTYTVGLI